MLIMLPRRFPRKVPNARGPIEWVELTPQWVPGEDYTADVRVLEQTRAELSREELLERFQDRSRTQRILDHLIQGRLLMASRDHVQLVHEALITRWERLSRWLQENPSQRRFRERLAKDTERWLERSRSPDILWRGRLLDEALASVLHEALDESPATADASSPAARKASR